MATFKLVIGTKGGKCVQKDLAEPTSDLLLGKKVGDKVEGDSIGFAGYEFQITGGSDYCGFPMRKDVEGPGRRRVLEISGIGLKQKAKGIRQRKTVCGNTIHQKTVQVNLKVLQEGKEPFVFPEKKAEDKK
ncbi:30S ribosomal protein S6e [Candidatus Woesearchaeota archaeon]|nr:30S ribosomal protein S6e [Candidatus Woesearchaeota archaeon]